MSLPRAARVASYCMRRSSSAECCCVCLCFANAARARSTASFSAAVPALASNSHLCRPTWLFSEKRSSDNARTIGLAESRPESEHRSLHMTRARQRTARSAHRPRRSRARGTARCAHLVRAINVPRRAKSRQAGAIDPFSIDEPGGGRVALGKSVMRFQSDKLSLIYHISKTEILYNTIFERIGCRMDRSRGSRGSGSGALLRWIAFFLLCARLSHRA